MSQMYTELEEIVALTTHGNAWLSASIGTQPPELVGSSPPFQHVASVRFLAGGNLVAAGTAQWFAYLRHRRAVHLRIVLGPFPPQVANAFRSKREWAIQLTYPDESGIWKNSTEANFITEETRRQLAHGRPLPEPTGPRERSYTELVAPEPLPEPPDTLEAAAAPLRSALEENARIARQAGADWFAERFVDGLRALDPAAPDPDSLLGMLPAGPSDPQAHRLLATADRSWAFGGMGWWYERSYYMPAEAAPEFEAAYGRLWQASLVAVAVGANAYTEGP